MVMGLLWYGHSCAGEVKRPSWSPTAIQRIAIGREEGKRNASLDLVGGSAGVELIVHAGASFCGKRERPIDCPGLQPAAGLLFPYALLAAERDRAALLAGVDYGHGMVVVQGNHRARCEGARSEERRVGK